MLTHLRRHPGITASASVAVAALVVAAILRARVHNLFDQTSSRPVRYSTTPIGDSFQTINLMSAFGLVALAVALVALIAVAVLTFRAVRAR